MKTALLGSKFLLLLRVKEENCAMKDTILVPLSNGHRLSWASRLLVIDHDVLTTYCGTISSTVVVSE